LKIAKEGLRKEIIHDVILNPAVWRDEESLFILNFNIPREILRAAQNDNLVTFSIPTYISRNSLDTNCTMSYFSGAVFSANI